MPLLRRCDANSGSNIRPATGVPDHRAANSEKEATLTKQANDFRGRIFSREDIFARGYFREKIFSWEDIFAGRYFRVNSKFAKISSRENISNSLFAKFSSRENKVLYSSPAAKQGFWVQPCTRVPTMVFCRLCIPGPSPSRIRVMPSWHH